MKATIEIEWSELTRTLSGDKGVETLIAKTKLPEGYQWLVVNGAKRKRFVGSRKIKLRESGKGQVTIDGVSGMTCEMVNGKTSDGEPIQFVMAREPVEFVPLDHLGIHTPICLSSVESDVRAYRGAIGRNPTPEKWAAYFRWAKSERDCTPEVLVAATAWHWMILEKRRGSPLKVHTERLIEHLERVKSLGVVVNPGGKWDSSPIVENSPRLVSSVKVKARKEKNPFTPAILAGLYEDSRNGVSYPLPHVIRESSIAADLAPYGGPLEEYEGWVERFGWGVTPATKWLAYLFNRMMGEKHKLEPFDSLSRFVSFPPAEPSLDYFLE